MSKRASERAIVLDFCGPQTRAKQIVFARIVRPHSMGAARRSRGNYLSAGTQQRGADVVVVLYWWLDMQISTLASHLARSLANIYLRENCCCRARAHFLCVCAGTHTHTQNVRIQAACTFCRISHIVFAYLSSRILQELNTRSERKNFCDSLARSFDIIQATMRRTMRAHTHTNCQNEEANDLNLSE